MTDTLFDLPDSLSPHLEWMRRHGVICAHYYDNSYEDFLFVAYSPTHKHKGKNIDPDEALTDFAIKNNLKLWNEE